MFKLESRVIRLIRSSYLYRTKYNFDIFCTYRNTLVADFKANTDEYRKCYELLSDELSRLIFINLLVGEMLLDCRYGMSFAQIKKGVSEFYITDLRSSLDGGFFQEAEILVDCGAYTGDTLQEFIKEGKKPQKYIGFEPDSSNFQKAQQTLLENKIPGVVHNAGVYSSSTVLCFRAMTVRVFAH